MSLSTLQRRVLTAWRGAAGPARTVAVGVAIVAVASALAPTSLIAQRQSLLNGRVGRYDYGSAGHYEWMVDEGSGTVNINTGGSTTNISLTSPDFDSSTAVSGYFTGSLAYQYEEKYSYYWVPDPALDEDPPVDTNVEFTPSADLLFSGYSGMMWEPGSGSASFSVNGEGASAAMTTATTPPPVGSITSDTSGHYDVHPTVTLSGYQGEFTLSYTGAMDAGENSAVSGVFKTRGAGGNRTPPGFIRITTPPPGGANEYKATIAVTPPNAAVNFRGKWWYDGHPDHHVEIEGTVNATTCGDAVNGGGTWGIDDVFYDLGPGGAAKNYKPVAILSFRDHPGDLYDTPMNDGRYRASTNLKVVHQ